MTSQLFWNNKAITYVALSLGFGAVYALNNVLTAPLLLAPGAHLIHLPSGFKFLLVLVFGTVGAFSIFTVSLCAGLGYYFAGNIPLSFELATANAMAPWLTRRYFLDHSLLQENLSNLSWKSLLTMGVLFSVLNSSLNQLILYWNQVILNMVDGLGIMLIGDLSGVLLVVGLIRLTLTVFKAENSHVSGTDKD
jgi:hypothetical protein